jgi:MinD-like ATPase involved in chromosome partitioning or flagellar assembly
VPFLGRIPLDPEIGIHCDSGEPFAMFCSDTETAQAFHDIANKVDEFVRKRAGVQIAAPKNKPGFSPIKQ